VARGSTFWGAKLGSDWPPRHGKRANGQSRGAAWRVILRASPVMIPKERAIDLALLSKSLGINDLCSSFRERVPSSNEGARVIMSV
jgi:hypothetical protein